MTGTNLVTVAPARAQLRAGGSIAAIVPQDAEQAWRMAEMIAKSGLAPRDMQSPEKIVTAIFTGLEIGLKPMQAVQSIAVVNGRPTVWGDAALGLVEASGLLEDFEEIVEGDGDAMVARCRAKRQGRASAIERTFSAADAKAAGLWNKSGPWQQYKRRMLQLRARAFTLRDGFADVLKGLQITEEARDYSLGPVEGSGAAPRVTGADLIAQAAAPPVTDAEIIEPPPAPVADDPPAEPKVIRAVPLGKDDAGNPDWSRWQATVLRGVMRAPDLATLTEWWKINGDHLVTFSELHPDKAEAMRETLDLRRTDLTPTGK
jgi:hypothetical protein